MENELRELWSEIQKILSVEVPTTVSYKTWIEPLVLENISANTMIISVPNEMGKGLVETKYLDLLKNAVNEVTRKDYDIKLVVGPYVPKQEISESNIITEVENTNINNFTISENQGSSTETGFLNPKSTFESFVIGNSNRFAHAACLAVAEGPSQIYNPLFIYGGVGLGKTHLMHAIGHRMKEINKDTKVLYVSSEKFTNDLIHAIQVQETEKFREKYRKNVDVIMIDDIQFIAKKDGTQLEMFHTFNDLKAAGKQIILSSDRPPHEIATLEDRLRTRFASGLIADIQGPDFETRVAILKKKAEMERYIVPDEVMIYIATRIKSNIRELEGALIRVMAYAKLTKNPINIELASEALKDIIAEKQNKNITIELIQEVVANFHNVTIDDLKSQRRTRNVALPRQIAMYLSRTLTQVSLPKIGEEFGKDHTTVMHAFDKIQEQMKTDEALKNTINSINKKLNAQD